MKKLFLFLCAVVFFSAFSLCAEIDVKTPVITAKLSPRGAMLTELTIKGQKWVASLDELGSFTDRLGQNQGEMTQGFADTATLDFAIKNYTATRKGTTVTFSACVGIIPGLKMEKSYFFSPNTPVIKITYTFTNHSASPIPLALYTRSFFRQEDGKGIYLQPSAQGPKQIMPGETSLPIKLPVQTFLAAADSKGKGLILKFPADDTAGVLCWLLKGGYTQEFLSSELPLLPGKSREFRLECAFSENVAAELKKNPLTAKKLKGALPVQVDRMCGIKAKAKLLFYRSVPTPEAPFIDCTFKRQPCESWRAVELPADKVNMPVAVYPLQNGIADCSEPLEFMKKGNILLVKIPALFPEKAVSADRLQNKGEFVYYATDKNWYGPVTMKCRIIFGVTGGKEVNADISAKGTLIRNGSMERSLPGKSTTPAFMPFAQVPYNKAVLQKDEKNNHYLRIGKYALFTFFPEYQKEYNLSLRARSVGGGGLTRIFIQFYDKNGKYLQEQRKIVYAGKETFDWKKFNVRFFVPDYAAVLRIAVINGSAQGQFTDIDDVELTLPVETRQSVSRKTLLRNELTQLWNLPLELLENISHELVTPHTRWFKPAAEPVTDVLFLSAVGNRIAEGLRREIVEFAQRLDMKYTHIPLIRKVKHVVSAYSVYPSYFEPQISEYTMECLKEIKKLPKVVCLTQVNFATLKDPAFIEFLRNWQKKGVNFIFFRCNAVPAALLGKEVRENLDLQLPKMDESPKAKPGHYRFYRTGKGLSAVVMHSHLASYIPLESRLAANVNYAMPYSFDFPWWEYHYLIDCQIFRRLAGVKPAARLVTASSGAVAVKALRDFTGTLEVKIESMHREVLLSQMLPVKAAAGSTVTIPDSFALPGGVFIANFRLLDAQGKVVDAGSVKLQRKEITPLEIVMADKEAVVPHPEKARFTVKAPQITSGCKMEVEIYNQRSEVLFNSGFYTGREREFAVELPHLRTFFNYIRARIFKGDKLIATVTKEFSVPQIPREMNDFYGFANAGSFAGASIKDLGFDFAIAGDPRWGHTPAHIRRTRTIGLTPIPRRGDEKMFRPYRADVKTAPVRTPCFSSSEFHAQLQKDTKFMAENCKFRYNDVNLLWSGDEMFLGRSVCTSPSCLAGFRKWLEKRFKTIDALNKNWGSNFKSFSDVLPMQLEDIKDKDRLGAWLDHKMYMTTVFAENFFGKAREEMEKYVPNVKIGPTGTQKPGFGYNWHELMKYCRIVGYYSGVQTKVIHDFADGSLMAGQCGGGYTHGHMDYEIYNYNTMWRTLLNGGNLAYHYHGCAYRGDGAPTRNMKFYTTSLKELKSGIGKLYLSAKPDFEAAILYSQPSLFAAMGSCGQDEWQNSQTSWAKLFEDLQVNARFINYEDLANKGVPAGIKVVVLPFALALSEGEIASLERFAAAGGMVIADCNTGIFDDHGRKRSAKELERLKFITPLNLSVARYNFVKLGGTGGELSSSGTGDTKFVNECRRKVSALLKQQKITPFVKLFDEKGGSYSCMAKFRTDGPTRIYGFHQEPDERQPGVFKDMKADKVKVRLPHKGHVYEVRSKRYLGNTATFEMPLVAGWTMIYAVLPVKPEVLKVKAPAGAARGTNFKFDVEVKPAKGAQVFRVLFRNAQGKELTQYSRNVRFAQGAGTLEFFLPRNLEAGKYTVQVLHVATGIKGEALVEVR